MSVNEREFESEIPYAIRGIISAIVLMTPFITFQTDFVQLPITLILIATGLLLWVMRKYPQPIWVWQTILVSGVLTVVTAAVSRQWYASSVALLWLWSMVLVFVLFTSWLQLGGWKKWTIVLFVASQILLAGPGIWTFFRSWQRATGFLYNANGLGGALLWGAIGGLVVVLAGKKKWWVFAVWSFVVSAWALTISLTAYLAAIAPVGLALWWYRSTIPWKKLSIAVVAIVIGVSVVWFGWRPQKLVSLMTNQHIVSSVTQRVEFDRVAIAMWREKSLTGWGIGTFKQTFPRFTKQYLEQPLYAHNVYLQVLAETGIVGGLGWLGVMVFLGRLGWRAVTKSDPEEKTMMQVLFLGWLAFSIHAAVDFSWHFPAGFMWWLIASAVFVVKNHSQSPENRQRGTVAFFLPVMVVLFVIAGASLSAIQSADRGLMAKEKNNDAEAIAEFNRAIRMTGNPSDITTVAEVYWLRRQGDDLLTSEIMLKKSVHRNYDNYFLHEGLGMNLVAQRRLPEALQAFSEAYRLDPMFHPQFGVNYIKSLQDNGRTEEAKTVLRDLLYRYRDPRSLNPIIVNDLPAIQALQKELLPSG